MFETRRLSSKIILQVILTIMVIPFLFPLIAMVQESLSGQGWGNYRAVWALGVVPEFFRNSAIIAASVIVYGFLGFILARRLRDVLPQLTGLSTVSSVVRCPIPRISCVRSSRWLCWARARLPRARAARGRRATRTEAATRASSV